jgi:hypothetical protein
VEVPSYNMKRKFTDRLLARETAILENRRLWLLTPAIPCCSRNSMCARNFSSLQGAVQVHKLNKEKMELSPTTATRDQEAPCPGNSIKSKQSHFSLVPHIIIS